MLTQPKDEMKLYGTYEWADTNCIRTRHIVRAVGAIPLKWFASEGLTHHGPAYISTAGDNETQYNYIKPFGGEWMTPDVALNVLVLDLMLSEDADRPYVFSHIDISAPCKPSAEEELAREIQRVGFHFLPYCDATEEDHLWDMFDVAHHFIHGPTDRTTLTGYLRTAALGIPGITAQPQGPVGRLVDALVTDALSPKSRFRR